LPPSHLHVQDSRLDNYNTTVNVLQSEEPRFDAAIQSSPGSHVSSTTFNTFRADSGQSLSSKFSQDKVGEKTRPSLNTLLSPPSRATEELVCLFGDMDGKLRAGATFQFPDQNRISRLKVDPAFSSQTPINATTLEQAKPRPRVKLNLQLAGDTIVQGQGISGRLVVHVRDHSRAELPVHLANNKLRIIGFEYLTDGPTFHVFFHYSCPFEELSYASEQIFSESPDYTDEEGYREARRGLHVLPFEMMLPVDSCFGKPKGSVEVPGGAAVRYIIMAYVLRVSSNPMLIVCSSSVHIKDSNTDRLSLAHFYRSCTIWPSLSLQEVLVPSTRALVSTAVMSLPHRGSCNKLKLSARVPRPSYFSGQHCHVHIQISNDTRKIVRSLRLTLIRTTTVYRPRSGSRSRGEYSKDGHTSSSYQAKAFVDEISESTLVMSERTTRRCVSSKGWWAGVNPQEKTALTHRILIPVRPYSDTLSACELAHRE
jgi:Arrestin (or S-antigen), C-terminal domain